MHEVARVAVGTPIRRCRHVNRGRNHLHQAFSIRYSGLSFCMPGEALVGSWLGGRSRLLLLPVTLATRPREMCEMTRVKSQG